MEKAKANYFSAGFRYNRILAGRAVYLLGKDDAVAVA